MHPENIVQFSAAVAYVHTTAAACASGFWARCGGLRSNRLRPLTFSQKNSEKSATGFLMVPNQHEKGTFQ